MKFVTTPSELLVLLDRKEQLAALKAKLTLPREQILDLSWCDTFEDWRRWEVRLPGSAIPNRLLAGSYWTEEGWDFLYIRRPVGVTEPVALNVLRIDLRGHDKYTRVIVSASEDDFVHLEKWFASTKPSLKRRKKS